MALVKMGGKREMVEYEMKRLRFWSVNELAAEKAICTVVMSGYHWCLKDCAKSKCRFQFSPFSDRGDPASPRNVRESRMSPTGLWLESTKIRFFSDARSLVPEKRKLQTTVRW